MDAGEEDILMHEMRAGVLKPSFVLVRDTRLRCVVLSIRGTHSFKDMFTSLTGGRAAGMGEGLVTGGGVAGVGSLTCVYLRGGRRGG